MIANRTGRTIPSTINTMLYPIVFRMMIQASFDLNRNSKFLRPIQGLLNTLLKNPPLILKFLKAIMIPNIGKKLNRMYQIVVGSAKRVSSVSCLCQRIRKRFRFLGSACELMSVTPYGVISLVVHLLVLLYKRKIRCFQITNLIL